MTLSPSSGPPGTSFIVRVDDLKRGQLCAVVLQGGDSGDSGYADESGRLRVQLTVPDDYAPGTYEVEAEDSNFSTIAIAAFTVK